MTVLGTKHLVALACGLAACAGAPPPPPAAEPTPVVVAPPSAPPPPVAVARPLEVAADAPDVPYRCAGGSLFVADDRPYCVQARPTPFAESQRWCADNGGKLLVVESAAQTVALSRMFAPAQPLGERAWIGLVQLRTGAWRWSTLAPVRATAWAPGEPNDAGGVEHCGELYGAVGLWNDLACDSALPFVCESRGRKGAPGKLACTGRSFQVGTTTYCASAERRASWDQAEAICKTQGGTLATFETDQELAAFRAATVSPTGTDRIWLGLTDEGHEGRFTDERGRGVDFTQWRSGEPNDAGTENCAEWYASDGGWNDIPCAIPHAGVCIPR